MQAKRQTVIHRKLISTDEIQAKIQKQKPTSLSHQASREADRFKGSRLSRMGRPKKHSLSSHSEKAAEDRNKFDLIPAEQRKRFHAKTRNIFTFFPTYTQCLDSNISDFVFNKTTLNPPEIEENKHFSTIHHAEEVLHYERKKLAPIRKPRKEKDNEGKKNSNVSFLNVQKVALQRMSETCDRDKDKMTASHHGRRVMIMSRNSEQFHTVGIDSKTIDIPEIFLKTHSARDDQAQIVRIKPFVVPFQRYYYFDFLWKVAYSNSIKTEFPETYPKKFKVYIGPGNNSMLVKTIFKRRESWWDFTTNTNEAHFVWTQIKVSSVFSSQQKNEPAPCRVKNQEMFEKKSLAYKKNLKIMNQYDTEKWMEYLPKNKETQQKMGPGFQKRSRILRKKEERVLSLQKVKIHNHFSRNYVIGNKKALFSTMKRYCECSNRNVFEFLPLTFHIENGLEDPEYFKFLQYFYKKSKEIKQSDEDKEKPKIKNIWIVKPGEFTNRGNGIIVCRSLEEVKSILKSPKKLENGGMRTYIVQEYMDRPFLYQKRKFDIRHFMMITSVNGHLKGYWYESGYIRTTSYEYSLKNGFSSVHLTNDAVQKNLPDYGKYEKGNKVSYDEFEKYLEVQYNGKYSFYKTIYPRMREIAKDCMRASAALLDEKRLGHNFQIFGFDFMISADFKPWLIEINTNPCLQLSCPVLMDVIPAMVENAIKIGVDSLLPPPHNFQEKRPRFNSNVVEQNKFQLLYDSSLENEDVLKEDKMDLNFKELEKDQQEMYEDDGVQLDD